MYEALYFDTALAALPLGRGVVVSLFGANKVLWGIRG